MTLWDVAARVPCVCATLSRSQDDLRPEIGAYGYKNAPATPALDKFAKTALVFKNAYVQYSFCCPSRASASGVVVRLVVRVLGASCRCCVHFHAVPVLHTRTTVLFLCCSRGVPALPLPPPVNAVFVPFFLDF